ncbi:MAG TPA: DUF1501 domain-containing protein, partial [Kiritimatiellia bacterium]|nr:DUF1501 domain-containing protein [Kiritimatiellia bacterium]
LFLYGGNDANNTLVPRDLSSYLDYQRDRGILALPREDLLPLNHPSDDGREFGLHPAMAPLLPLFEQQRMAILCNVGTLIAPITKAEYQAGGAAIPPHLFSHNDQQVQWQTSVPDSPKMVGWGGRMADLLQSLNAGSNISMNISIAGSNFFQVGDEVIQYHVTPDGTIGLTQHDATWSPVREGYQAMSNMLGRSYGHLFEQEYANTVNRAVANDTLIKTALANVPDHLDTFANSTLPSGALNHVARQLRMILRLIEARQTLGMRRQIFFAALGGFDTHDEQLDDHNALLGMLSHAIADFYHGTQTLGIADNVTLFTASDFNRTYNSNGKGSDHAWGGHHIVVGGDVNGGQLYGQVPILAIQGPQDTGTRGSWIPTISTDEMSATLARWFGISETNLPLVLPNIHRFPHPNLGFMAGT